MGIKIDWGTVPPPIKTRVEDAINESDSLKQRFADEHAAKTKTEFVDFIVATYLEGVSHAHESGKKAEESRKSELAKSRNEIKLK